MTDDGMKIYACPQVMQALLNLELVIVASFHGINTKVLCRSHESARIPMLWNHLYFLCNNAYFNHDLMQRLHPYEGKGM
jgi:hypothetical protein